MRMPPTHRAVLALVASCALAVVGCGSGKRASTSAGTSKSASASSSASASARSASAGKRCEQIAAAASPTGPTVATPALRTLVRSVVAHPPNEFSFTERSCVGSHHTTLAARAQLHPHLRMLIVNHTGQGFQEERLIGETVYVKIPDIASRDGGRPWVLISLATAGKAVGLNLQKLIGQVSNANPNRTLRLLLTRKLRSTGAVRIVGRRAFGYRTTFTPADLAQGTVSPDLVKQLRAVLARVKATSETISVYVSPQGKVVRIVTLLRSSSLGPLTTVEAFHSTGGPLQIGPPPASQLVPFLRLRQLAGGG